MINIVLPDVAAAPVAIAGMALIMVAVFFIIMFLIILAARKITNKDKQKNENIKD